MNVDALAIALRPRPMLEAADLGVRLVQRHARSLCASWLPVALAVVAVAAASVQLSEWGPLIVLALFRAWLDRTLLFVLARAAFGQETRFADVFAAWRHVWLGNFLLTFTLRPLSPWRSYTQPVYQLEGLRGAQRAARKRQIARGKRGVASLLTGALWLIESAVVAGAVMLLFWFAPPDRGGDVLKWLMEDGGGVPAELFLFGCQAVAFLLIEPFYVAGGFTMYLNRRVELEAWDIEQEFRRAFGEHTAAEHADPAAPAERLAA
jgi:hypothetical protein